MWLLVQSDFWRDGGSYSAVLSDDERTVGLWLQVNPWNTPDEISYDALYLSDGNDPTRRERLVPAHDLSPWLDAVRATDTSAASDEARTRFAELITRLERLASTASAG
jgi:hypothetical protein